MDTRGRSSIQLLISGSGVRVSNGPPKNPRRSEHFCEVERFKFWSPRLRHVDAKPRFEGPFSSRLLKEIEPACGSSRPFFATVGLNLRSSRRRAAIAPDLVGFPWLFGEHRNNQVRVRPDHKLAYHRLQLTNSSFLQSRLCLNCAWCEQIQRILNLTCCSAIRRPNLKR